MIPGGKPTVARALFIQLAFRWMRDYMRLAFLTSSRLLGPAPHGAGGEAA